MNDIFNIKRFGQYLASDIKDAAHNCGLSLLLLGCSGLLISLAGALYGLVFHGVWDMPGYTARYGISIILLLIASISLPVKCYGHITDKKRGTAFILTPASALEKSISMIVVAGVIVPLLVVAIYFGLDALAVKVFADMGEPLINPKALQSSPLYLSVLSAAGDNRSPEFLEQMGAFTAYFLGHGWQLVKYLTNALLFLLGAIVFKKQKGAKTILSMIVLGMLLSAIKTPAAMLNKEYMDMVNSQLAAESLFESLTQWVKVVTIVFPIPLCGGIFYRVKTIKH